MEDFEATTADFVVSTSDFEVESEDLEVCAICVGECKVH